MAEQMSDERLTEIRERAESVRTWKAVWGPPIPQLCDVDIPDLLAEVERLRAEVATVRSTSENWESALKAQVATAEAERDELRVEVGEWTRLHGAVKGDLTLAEAERDRLAEQVERVRDLHAPEDDPRRVRDCKGCRTHVSFTPYERCKTIAALDGPEAGS